MTAPPVSAGAPRLAYAATVVMMIQQSLSTMAGLALPVLVPPIAAETGLSPGLVGFYVPILYAGSMISSIAGGGFLLRFGGFRIGQICLLVTGTGMLICAEGHLALLALGGLVIGLGNGPSTPAGSHVLARYAKGRNAPMLFSIKQTGVPLGGMLAGTLLPIFVLQFGWRGALVCAAAMSFAFVVLGQPLRREFDFDRQPGRTLRMLDVRATLGTVIREPRIRELAMAACVYTGLQVTFASFFVAFVSIRLGWTLTEAGAAYSAAMMSGIGFRILWGWLAARFIPPVYILAMLGAGMACGIVAIAFVAPGWSTAAIWGLAILFGATGIGFQGVLLAEVARIAPHGMAGVITGGIVFFAFVGMIVFPAAFGLLLSLGVSYETCFAASGVCPALVAATLLASAVRRSRSGPGASASAGG